MTSYGLYGPKEYTQHYRRKGYQANPINAVVVLQWDSKDKNNHVYLTNGPVDEAFDDYDDRRLIENCLFREGKGPWNLLPYFPQRNEQGVLVHNHGCAGPGYRLPSLGSGTRIEGSETGSRR